MGPGTSKEATLDKIEGMKCIWSNFFLPPILSNLRFIFTSDFPIISLYSFMERSGRVLDSRPRGLGFEPHRRHCVVVVEQDTFILA